MRKCGEPRAGRSYLRKIGQSHALCFGISLSVIGAIYLAVTTNALASLLSILTLLAYLFLYTPLKRKTPLCTLIGALPGAMPPLIGWAAACGRLDGDAWLLFVVVFLWQFPHFMAIAWTYREDYARAGYLVLPAGKSKDRFVAWQTLLHPWHFSEWFSFLQFGVSLELFILQALFFLEALFSATAHALLFECLSLLHGSCCLLPSSIFRCCCFARVRQEMNMKRMLRTMPG